MEETNMQQAWLKKCAKLIDHTNLKPDASVFDIIKLCNEAITYNFYSVCINSAFLNLAYQILDKKNVKLCTVIGFPLGGESILAKGSEAKRAILNHADEVDMVINISALKEYDYKYLLDEINYVKKQCENKVLKVIVETCLLTFGQKCFIAGLIKSSNADFIKTSTGFSKKGALIEDVLLFKKILNHQKQIKAAGGIRDLDHFLAFATNGADRIGCSSSVFIMESLNTKLKNGFVLNI